MLTQIKLSKKNKKSVKSKTLVNIYDSKESKSSIEDTKKYYLKYNVAPNNLFISQLKTKDINIILSNYNYNDISVVYGILKKCECVETISLSPEDPYNNNKNNNMIKKKMKQSQ